MNHNTQSCKYCGTLHKRRKCPAFGKTCLKCNKLNHFASVCLTSQRRIEYTEVRPQAQHESDYEDFFIGIVEQTEYHTDTSEENTKLSDTKDQDWFISLQSNGSTIQYKMDTGAQANMLPLSTYHQLNTKPNLERFAPRNVDSVLS